MSFKTVRQGQNTVWPTVRESLRLHQASRAAAREGKKLSRMEERDNAKSWNRVVSEETVWAIARADLLASPEHAAVIQAAIKWTAGLEPLGLTPDDLDTDERALYDAVQTYVAEQIGNIDDVEDLQLSPESATVVSTTH